MTTQPASRPSAPMKQKSSWWRILFTGFLFYVVGLALLIVTGNVNLFPTVVMLGVFMVPAAYAAFFYDHRHLSQLTAPTVALSFLYGGLLGVSAASILEPLLINRLSPTSVFSVGLIEEFAKILGVFWIARRMRHDAELDGLILGAAAGMGFAALESMGYAFTGFLRSGGSLSFTVYITLIRGISSPLGHGTWTAILAAVIFREAKARYFRLNTKVLGAYLTVVVLHALWDLLPFVMAMYFLPGLDLLIGVAIVGGISLFILWRLWREGRQRQENEAAAVVPLVDAQATNIH